MINSSMDKVEFDFIKLIHDSGGRASAKIIGEFRNLINSQINLAGERIVHDICVIIDQIESQSETNTLEEWKQYKHIRNAIRDKFLKERKEK